MEQKYEIDLKKLFLFYIRKLWLILLIAFLGGCIGFCVSKYLIYPKYESHLTFYVKNEANRENTTLTDINTAKTLVNTYIAVLQDDVVMRQVGDQIIKDYGLIKTAQYFPLSTQADETWIEPEVIRDCYTMQSVNDTEVLKITARTGDPYVSADLCNIISKLAPELLIRVVGAGSIEIIGDAKVDLKKVAPSNAKNAIIAAVLSGIGICGILLLADLLNNKIKDKDTLEKRLSKAVLGEIHLFGKPSKRNRTESCLINEKTPFHIIEAYKEMRTNIMFCLATKTKKAVAITSANAGDGKSTTAVNLAISLAEAGKSILLIDADMRKPSIHKKLDIGNQAGLSNVISQMNYMEEVIQKSIREHMDVITAGPQPPNPSELLTSEQMKDLLAQAEKQYDYIVIDTPPINVVSDALGLASFIGGTVITVKYSQTTFDDLNESVKKINLCNMSLLGFIINGVENKKENHYKYSKKYYNYEYRRTEEV